MSKSQLLPLSEGTLIKGYKIIELLGSGGFGAVYKAQPQNGSPVAIKETYFENEEELRMFRNEATLLSSLSDEDFPKVISHFDSGQNRYYLIMELIEGDDLGDVLEKRGRPIPLETVLDWADKILESLEYLHSKGIIHRDIKPANLKLTPKGRIKIIDLGIAKDYFNKATNVNSVSSIGAATPYYAPIEQHLKIDENFILMLMICSEQKTKEILAQGTDARADIYALGVTLYRLLTNKVPAISPNRALAVWSRKNDLVIPSHQVNTKIPLEISQVLYKALEINRENRYNSATEMRVALSNAIVTVRKKGEQQYLSKLAKRESDLVNRERQVANDETQTRQSGSKKYVGETKSNVVQDNKIKQIISKSNEESSSKYLYWFLGAAVSVIFIIFGIGITFLVYMNYQPNSTHNKNAENTEKTIINNSIKNPTNQSNELKATKNSNNKDVSETDSLVKDLIQQFKNGVENEDFADLFNSASTAFKKKYTTEKVNQEFNVFIKAKHRVEIVLDGFEKLTPEYTSPPSISVKNGYKILTANGTFATSPTTTFNTSYVLEKGAWKMLTIEINIK